MSAQQSHYRVAALMDYSNKMVERMCYNQIINREINWDKILRLITSIKLKEYTASQIFRRLNSCSRQHPV
jgi:TnpA family transposase